MRNLQEQVKKEFCYQKLFWPFTVWINCSSHRKFLKNSWLSASNFKSFSRSLEQFFQTVKSQNNFGNKTPFLFLFSLSISNVQLFVAFNKWLWVEIEVKVQLDQFITFMSIKIQRKSFLNTFFSPVTKKELRIIVNKLDCCIGQLY